MVPLYCTRSKSRSGGIGGIPKGLSMTESGGIDFGFWGTIDAKAVFQRLACAIIEAIEAGASRREAADRYELSPSVVVLWAQRWEQTGSVAAKPSVVAAFLPLWTMRNFCWCSSSSSRT